MKKIILLLIVISLWAFPVEASTKQDIIDFVYDNAQCGTETAIFQSYNRTYNRLLKEKELTTAEIEEVLELLAVSYQIINDNNACSLSDINKLNDAERKKLLNSLDKGARIIHNAPSIRDEVDEKRETKPPIVYDRDQKTLDIYDRDALIDRISLAEPKLTYTGPNIYLTYSIIIAAITFTGAMTFQVLSKKRHKARFYKKVVRDLLWGLSFTAGMILIGMLVLNNYVDTYASLRSLLANVQVENNVQREIILDDENNIIGYPAYGNRYGELLIPNVGIASHITFGDAPYLLEDNIGHYTPSAFPGEGEVIIYSGHNNDEHLKNLEQINLSDQIIVNASYGQFIYEVAEVKIIGDRDWHLLTGDDEVLILYTCYPFSSFLYGSRRYVVYAPLVEMQWNEGAYYE